MRLFQNSALSPAYLPRLRRLSRGCKDFADHVRVFLNDRYGACHFLQPVLDADPRAFFTNGDDELVQRTWATEHGLRGDVPLASILLAQIEEHRSEVFYNLDPVRYGSDFVRRLPGCVKKSLAWRAAPSPRSDFGAYHRIVCNFPGILDAYRRAGWNAAYFAPGHDPVMDAYAAQSERPIDVLFVGGFSRHHRRRAALLQAVAGMRGDRSVVMHLDRSRSTRWAESPLGRLLPLGSHRRPREIAAVAREPVFGVDLYATLAQAKVVINGAIDMAGPDRGNMRCFEAMGCACVLVSDAGRYPDGMKPGTNLLTYASPTEAVSALSEVLRSSARLESLARAGYELVRTQYSKAAQWRTFQTLVQ